ncbi:aminopeptidase P N-terminal domain-containing protein [Candidatus Saccharibacteria bacterium]|nr:aminopeptidase P N-terminal domain-containing protein [Candidatus Saccharibacteria bacterium]
MAIINEFFVSNRLRLAESINGGLIVVSAYAQLQRGNDTAFYFDQEANFWWLTGINFPDWWVIIDGQRAKSWLVAPDVSDSHQIFNGSLSAEAAKLISGVDNILTHDEAIAMLRDMAKKHSVVYAIGDHAHVGYFDFVLNPAPKKLWNALERTFTDVQDCRLQLAKLRAIKQPEEIVAIKKAIKLTVDGFNNVKQKLPDLRYEYEIEAEFSYLFKKHGASGHAYDPIIASGKNACTLHYSTNQDRLKKSNIVLMDVGARVGGYAADISRSYAIGEPTPRQQQVHGAVQAAHQEIIQLIKPGLLVADYHSSVDIIMKNALIDLNLLKSAEDETTYRRYFPHAIGHGLGVDVHDSLGQSTEFSPGMVFTVEPGIYIPDEGIGVRIEDNILVTQQGHTNLSRALSTSL